ncbi:hypothetical protein ACOSP7_012380 [Xanthoceras sorbifolium]
MFTTCTSSLNELAIARLEVGFVVALAELALILQSLSRREFVKCNGCVFLVSVKKLENSSMAMKRPHFSQANPYSLLLWVFS